LSSPAAALGERRASPISGLRGSLIGRNPALARMLLAGFISTCGDRLHQVALAALVLGMTNSMASAGLIFVVATIPYALFGLIVGALVDRWDRRTILVVADLARAAIVVLIPLAATINLPLVYPLLFVLTCFTMAFNPARQSSIPDLVGVDELGSANSLFQAVNYIVDLLAFPLAGVLVAGLIDRLGSFEGTQVAFGVDGVSYLISAALLVRLPGLQRSGSLAREPLARLPRQVADGLRFLRDNVQVRTNTILMTVGPLMLGSLHTLWIGFAWRVSDTGTFGYGVTETLNAMGTLLGLLLLRRIGNKINTGRVILIGFAVMGGSIAAAGLTDSLVVVSLLAAVAGLGNMMFLVPSITMVQRATPAALRGRVFTVRLMLTFSAFSISNAIAGGFSDLLGVSPLFLILGSGMLLLAVCGSFVASARDVP
jgi:MFS family permease